MGIDALMRQHRLDAIVCPTSTTPRAIDMVMGDAGGGGDCTTPAAVAGYPHVTVPAGFVRGLPVGVSFFGRAWSEPKLIGLAYAFQQATPRPATSRVPGYRGFVATVGGVAMETPPPPAPCTSGIGVLAFGDSMPWSVRKIIRTLPAKAVCAARRRAR